MTAVGIALVAAEVTLRWRRAPAPVAFVDSTGATTRWWPWLGLAVGLVAWELVSLFLSPRPAHPTISSLYDSASQYQAVKAACFFLWFALGAALVRG